MSRGNEKPETLEGELLKEMHRIQHEVLPRLEEMRIVNNEVSRLKRFAARAVLYIENHNTAGMKEAIARFREYR